MPVDLTRQFKPIRIAVLTISDSRGRAEDTSGDLLAECVANAGDLSPKDHPAMGRILWSFEPVWLGDATGRGAEPSTQRSVPSRCMSDAVSLA